MTEPWIHVWLNVKRKKERKTQHHTLETEGLLEVSWDRVTGLVLGMTGLKIWLLTKGEEKWRLSSTPTAHSTASTTSGSRCLGICAVRDRLDVRVITMVITTSFQIRRPEHSAMTVALKNGKHLWLWVKTLGLLNACVLLTLCSSAYWYEQYRPTVSTLSYEGTGSENLFVVVTPLSAHNSRRLFTVSRFLSGRTRIFLNT